MNICLYWSFIFRLAIALGLALYTYPFVMTPCRIKIPHSCPYIVILCHLCPLTLHPLRTTPPVLAPSWHLLSPCRFLLRFFLHASQIHVFICLCIFSRLLVCLYISSHFFFVCGLMLQLQGKGLVSFPSCIISTLPLSCPRFFEYTLLYSIYGYY